MPSKPRAKKAPASVAAREAEATGDGFVTVEQCGVELRIAVGGKMPLAAIDEYRAGNAYEGIKQQIGKQQWKALLAAGATRDDLQDLDKKIAEAQGN